MALGGLGLGYLVYARRPLEAGQADPLVAWLGPFHTVLKNRYYVDELYQIIAIRPASAFATFVGQVIDQQIIDGVLAGIARGAGAMAQAYRAFDLYVVNAAGDGIASSIKSFGRSFREIQSGKVQEYLMLSVLIVAALVLVVMLILPSGL